MNRPNQTLVMAAIIIVSATMVTLVAHESTHVAQCLVTSGCRVMAIELPMNSSAIAWVKETYSGVRIDTPKSEDEANLVGATSGIAVGFAAITMEADSRVKK